ncbi:MAG: hypothetical protein K6C94_03680 [Candidatus Gastranaerophilales bacterium]|nr:hypothetical protein [Candidatus Gastranaerophilales bacterium]
MSFDTAYNYLLENDFENFEKSIAEYIALEPTLSEEDINRNYNKIKECLLNKTEEHFDNKDGYITIFRYIYRYLEEKDYDSLNFWLKAATNFQKFELDDLALDCYLTCLKFKNNSVELFRVIGELFFKKKNYVKAVKFLEKYVEKVKTNAYIYNLLGHMYETLYKSEDVDKQILCFETAYKLEPYNKAFIKNAALVAGKNKNLAKFIKYSKMILDKNPTNDELFDYACWSFYNKIFKNTHKYYHSRFFKENGATPYPDVNNKLWNGEPISADKKLLIRYEQGFGDSVMFVRFLPEFKKLVPNFTFKVQQALCSLFRYSFPELEIIPDTEEFENFEYDYQMPLMDLMSVMKITDKTIPLKSGYIDVSEEKREAFKREHLNTEKFKIGIAFRGNADFTGDNRDIPVGVLAKIAELDEVQVYSLQVENKQDLFDLPQSQKITDLSPFLSDFEQTAAAMKNMDLIISTDNVLLNLAGAMGLKTFGLFNFYTDYRWFTLKGNNTGWYNSVTAYKAKRFDDWEELFDRVLDDVRKISVSYRKN